MDKKFLLQELKHVNKEINFFRNVRKRLRKSSYVENQGLKLLLEKK